MRNIIIMLFILIWIRCDYQQSTEQIVSNSNQSGLIILNTTWEYNASDIIYPGSQCSPRLLEQRNTRRVLQFINDQSSTITNYYHYISDYCHDSDKTIVCNMTWTIIDGYIYLSGYEDDPILYQSLKTRNGRLVKLEDINNGQTQFNMGAWIFYKK